MNVKPTNGPLEISTMVMSKKDFTSLYSSSLVTIQSGVDVLAIVWSPDDDDREGEHGAKANAKLFSSAPGLLTALRRIGSILDPGESDPEMMAGMLRQISRIQTEALKKARGEL